MVQKASASLGHLDSHRAREEAKEAEEEAYWQAETMSTYCMMIAQKTGK